MRHALLLCLLLNALVASGQTSYWEELPAPPGGAPTRVTQTANGWVYAEFYDHAVFCSQDNGLHWQQIFWPSSDPDTGFAKITVGRAGTLFAERRVDDNDFAPFFFDVYTSVDNGATWQHLLDSTAIHGLGETSTGRLFALKDSINSSYQLVVRSDNGGGAWQTVKTPSGSGEYYEQVAIGGYDEAWVGREEVHSSYIHYSVDGGDTWLGRHLLFPTITALSFSGTLLYDDYDRICRFTSGGTTTCFFIDSTLSSTYNRVSSIIQLPDSSIYAATSRYFYKSQDDGVTWQRLGPTNRMLNVHGDRPLFDGTWLASNGTTTARSTDLGATWSFSAFGINQGQTYDFSPISQQEWLAWTGTELWHTQDAGQTWSLRRDNTGQAAGLNLENMITNSEGNTWIVAKDSLLFTPDLGLTFQNITPPVGLADRAVPRIGFNGQQNTLFVSTLNGTMHTQDNGITWQITMDSFYIRKMVPHTSGALFALFDSIYWYPTHYYPYSLLFRSDDEGQTWQRVSNERIDDVVVSPTGGIFALFKSKIHYSADIGNTWVPIQWSGDHLAVDPGGFLFSFNPNSSASMSVDGGHTWQVLPEPPAFENVTTSSIWFLDFDNQSHMYIQGWEYAGTGARGRLFRTANPTHEGAWLTGTVFKDADGDCSTLDPESTLDNWIVRAEGNDAWWATTDSAGRYSLFLDTGAYFLTVKPALNLLWETCADSLPVQLPVLLDTTEQDVPVLAVADCPYMTVQVIAPWLERCFDGFVWVSCCNQGTEGADSAWVDITLDPALIFTDTTLNYEALGNNTFRFQLGAMPQGYCQNFMFRVYVDCDSTVLGQTACVMAHVYPDSLCIEPAEWSGAEISVAARCEQDSVLRFDVTNTGPVPTQGLHYFVIEDDVVLMESNEIYQPNQTRTFSLPANGSFRRFESEQEPGHPFSMQVAAWAEGCGGFQNGGFPNWYFLNNGIPSQDVYCGELVGSFDPNDKQGFPVGYGSDHLVAPNTDIEYLVRFQNTGTAPARRVMVRDTLSGLLDPATLRMGPTSHPATWTLDGQGVLIVTFSDINLPDSTSDEAASHGFFSFSIAQKPDLPNGTVIHNTASIYFDFNSPIHTNKTRHQIGRNFITVAISDPEAPLTNVRVFPNPVTETASLTFEGLPEGTYRFVLLDALGKTRLDAPLNGNSYTLQGEELANGVYFFQILDDRGKSAGTGKVLMQR